MDNNLCYEKDIFTSYYTRPKTKEELEKEEKMRKEIEAIPEEPELDWSKLED